MNTQVRRNFNQRYRLVIAAMGTAGTVKSVALPSFEIEQESFRASDMITADKVDMGLAEFGMSLTMFGHSYELIAKQGMGKDGIIPMTLYKSVNQGDDTRAPSKVVARVKIVKYDRGDEEIGKLGETSFELEVKYYREEFNGSTIHEIDTNPENQICVINGVDYMAKDKENLGL